MKRVFRILLYVLAGLTVLIASGIRIARALLPATECEATGEKIAALVVEKMTYDDVKRMLGCDGHLSKKENFGDEIDIEYYKWRGPAWPYDTFEGQFIDGVLHGTARLTLDLDVSFPWLHGRQLPQGSN